MTLFARQLNRRARGKGASPRPACGTSPQVPGAHRSAPHDLFGFFYSVARAMRTCTHWHCSSATRCQSFIRSC